MLKKIQEKTILADDFVETVNNLDAENGQLSCLEKWVLHSRIEPGV